MSTTATSKTAREVRLALLAQPALATEIKDTIRREGRAAGLHLLAHRLDADYDRAAAGWYRFLNPRSRCVAANMITRNGGTVREYTSLVDGSVIRMCANYPITKRVWEWMVAQTNAIATARPSVLRLAAV